MDPLYTVPVAFGPKPGGKSPLTAILIVVIVLLVLLIVFTMWRRQRLVTPDCSRYGGSATTGGPYAACTHLTNICGGDARCLNAVARCMPTVDQMNSISARAPAGGLAGNPSWVASQLDGAGLQACTRAITRIDPHFIAQVAVKYGGPKACLPLAEQEAIAHRGGYRQMVEAAKAIAPLLPYSVRVSKSLPPCPAPVVTPH